MSDIIQFGNCFAFGDVISNQYGVWISGTGTFDSPEADLEFVTIPGRSGDLIRNNKRFRNIELTYPCFISKGFDTRFDEFKAALLAKAGTYQRLSDTYHPDHFRLATLYGGISPATGPYNRAGTFELVFNCKPQRFLKLGEQPITFTADGALWNPTQYEAKPFIRAYGTGTLTLNGYTIAVNYANGYTDIDCELQDAYRGVENCNGYITVEDYEYPVLTAGNNAVEIDGFSRVEITPRWWTV